MSEEKPQPKEQSTETSEETQTVQDSSKASVKKGSLVVGLAILLSLTWYLLSDRFTPFTSQARVQGYVVGVAPKVAGLVTQVWVNNNQQVDEGQPLFEIDPSQYRIALNKAQSDLGNARSQVDAGSAAVESARANLRAAQANELKARQDSTRLERLHRGDPGTISVRRLEVSRASLDQARAKVAAAESAIQQAIEQKGGNDDDNNAILNVALSAVEKAELDLANTVVKASSDGMITDLRADVGQYAATGNPVMTLVAVNDVWISAEFTENNLGHLRPGSPVEILFDVLPGQVFEGKVRSIGLGVSAGQAQPPGTLPTIDNSRDWLRQSQRFPVIIGFDVLQQQALRSQLRIGGQVSVIAYSEGHELLSMLGRAYIRLMSWLSYAY
ncbi:MAG: HlyD family secretion protein [Gammaproteobacteria bacterium]|nr:HlyD family secretion protein [Gammaproteobacteria bacterium]